MNLIYRGQEPPKSKNALWIKGKKIYAYGTSGWEEASAEIIVDDSMIQDSTNPVQSKVIQNSLQETTQGLNQQLSQKQDKVILDENLSESSTNLIENNAVLKQYITDAEIDEIVSLFGSSNPYAREYFTIEALGNGTITWRKSGSNSYYSTDNGATWLAWNYNFANIQVSTGNKIIFKSITSGYSSSDKLSSTCQINISGNFKSLFFGDDFYKSNFSTTTEFKEVFSENANLISAENLVLETREVYCSYYNLFKNCTGLIKAPQLPAKKLYTASCYQYMFNGCTSLTATPNLPATILSERCYERMFYNCTSLTQASKLPATTLSEGCYSSMFYKCTNLVTAPALKATELSSSCYLAMFAECSSLTTVSDLPATSTKQNCYTSMFAKCTSLITAPGIYATSLEDTSCQSMFADCTSLTTVPVFNATYINNTACNAMFQNCINLVNIPNNPTITYVGNNGCLSMFYGCSSLTSTLNINTYANSNSFYLMYGNCSSLTTVNIRLSSGASSQGCREMFKNCTSLVTCNIFNSSTIRPRQYYETNCFTGMFEGCTALASVQSKTYESDSSANAYGCSYDSMYKGCTSLTDVSGIIIKTPGANSSNEFKSMFEGCTSLTTGPTMNFANASRWALNKGTCTNMFKGCSSLTYIKCLLPKYNDQDMSTGNFTTWVQGVAASGTFVRSTGADYWSTGDSGIPSGWTIQDA